MKLSDDNPRAFTASTNVLANILESPAYIGEPYDPQRSKPSQSPVEYIAIWDTGATGTVITKKVVQDCDLKQVGMAKVQTVGGDVNSPVYFVSLYLPNKVIIPQLRVVEGILFGPAEILIGMDIINRGDFAITNKNNKTTFSFRMPSLETINFVKQMGSTIPADVIPVTGGTRAAKRREQFGR